jgi:hypothetical protein
MATMSFYMPEKKTWVDRVTFLTAVTSMLVTVVYGTWFIGSIEKRVSILEQNNIYFAHQIQDFKDQLDKANLMQDASFTRFQDSVNQKLNKMEDKIEIIYTAKNKDK